MCSCLAREAAHTSPTPPPEGTDARKVVTTFNFVFHVNYRFSPSAPPPASTNPPSPSAPGDLGNDVFQTSASHPLRTPGLSGPRRFGPGMGAFMKTRGANDSVVGGPNGRGARRGNPPFSRGGNSSSAWPLGHERPLEEMKGEPGRRKRGFLCSSLEASGRLPMLTTKITRYSPLLAPACTQGHSFCTVNGPVNPKPRAVHMAQLTNRGRQTVMNTNT